MSLVVYFSTFRKIGALSEHYELHSQKRNCCSPEGETVTTPPCEAQIYQGLNVAHHIKLGLTHTVLITNLAESRYNSGKCTKILIYGIPVRFVKQFKRYMEE